jgi:hypothetical protein
MRCDNGKHELTVLKAQCPFCEIERLRSTLEDIASGELGVNLCIKYAKKAVAIPFPTPEGPKP